LGKTYGVPQIESELLVRVSRLSAARVPRFLRDEFASPPAPA
jgi:hypothetical protein